MFSLLQGWTLAGRDDDDAEAGQVHLYLNVYDLTPINKYLYWLGLGVFHSGIEVHGIEFGFGAHEYPSSAVFEVEPKSCPGFVFRRSMRLGSINMSESEFRSFMRRLSRRYHGDSYHLIAKNCNHFTDDVCFRLTGKPIPGWVNRLARFGAFCNCLLPESIQLTTVMPLPDRPSYFDNDLQSVSSLVLEESDDEDYDDDDDDDDDNEGSDHRLLTASSGDRQFIGKSHQ